MYVCMYVYIHACMYVYISNVDLLEKKGWKVPPPPPINQVNEEINKLHVAIRDQEAVNEQITIELQRLQTFTENRRYVAIEYITFNG